MEPLSIALYLAHRTRAEVAKISARKQAASVGFRGTRGREAPLHAGHDRPACFCTGPAKSDATGFGGYRCVSRHGPRPEITQHVAGPWDDPDAHRSFVERRTNGPHPRGLGYWTIRRREKQSFLGWVRLIPQDARGRKSRSAGACARNTGGRASRWRGPANSRTCIPGLGYPRVIAGIMAANTGSVRVAFRLNDSLAGPYCGFTLTAEAFAVRAKQMDQA
jgi:hypothetical protein